MANTLYKKLGFKTLTLKLYKIFTHKAVKVRELGNLNGWLCWSGVKKILPKISERLEKGEEIKLLIVAYKEEI